MASRAAENDLTLFEQDLNDTVEYEDLSMETSNTSSPNSGNLISSPNSGNLIYPYKRVRSESEDSDPSLNNTKKHIGLPTHDYTASSTTRLGTGSQSSLIQIVFAESDEVNLSKINPIYVAQTLNDLVGRVEKVFNTQNGLKILCNKSQANLLKKEQKFGRYRCIFTIQNRNDSKPKIRGIMHGIPLDTDISDIEKELQIQNSFVDIEKVFRLQKFDKIQEKKIDTESLIVVFRSEINFPSQLYLGYRRYTIKEFIPHPVRCFRCQKFGHISKNCRGKQKCPLCSENHSFDECQNIENKKCTNCGGSHSAGFKGCPVFVKAKEIKEFSHLKKITYAEATKQINLIKNMENQTNQTSVIKNANEDQIINKILEKVENQSKQNKEQIVDEIVEQIHSQNKQNEEQIIDKIIEQVQTKSKENEEITIEKISDNILVKTKEYQNELVDDMIRKTEHHCKCEFPPEGLLVFIIRALKCYKSEKFLKNSGDIQSRLLIDIFEKCTDIKIDEIKFKKIIQS